MFSCLRHFLVVSKSDLLEFTRIGLDNFCTRKDKNFEIYDNLMVKIVYFSVLSYNSRGIANFEMSISISNYGGIVTPWKNSKNSLKVPLFIIRLS